MTMMAASSSSPDEPAAKDDIRKRQRPSVTASSSSSSSLPWTWWAWNGCKLAASIGFLGSSATRARALWGQQQHPSSPAAAFTAPSVEAEGWNLGSRRLQEEVDAGVPSYLQPAVLDLKQRKQLFDETPPEEVKYWFEYTGPLQKYYYRFSKSRGKADYFEGRDDSGVVSARFIDDVGGTEEYQRLYAASSSAPSADDQALQRRLLENCWALGSEHRPNTKPGSVWHSWFGQGSSSAAPDRCRLLFALNMVGAGRGATMLWETEPPSLTQEGPPRWMSEQETAATHLQRQLQEIDHMCEAGVVAARVQVLVCEPIADAWVDWMDALLEHCGGTPVGQQHPPIKSGGGGLFGAKASSLEERPSPVQVVVAGSAQTADRCHDLKSGFMEKRSQDLLLAPPPKAAVGGASDAKATDPSLVSSDHHDVYISLKWSSLVTIRAVHSFLQASADLAAAAGSSSNNIAKAPKDAKHPGPASPFLIPSFVRVSYVSEENAKVAKWRMHGDFFHPAAWEICRDSFDVTWIDHSLSGSGGVRGICKENAGAATGRRLQEAQDACGQWWVYFTELQMSTKPEIYANEAVPPPVQGGSNYVWMLTERHRQQVVQGQACRAMKAASCPDAPQAVLPLGDLESFLINYTPNTGLGKKHVEGRRPGYSRQEERDRNRERVRERKQLHDEEDIEKALFDYTVYPAALFRKDATLKAARQRDAELSPTDTKPSETLGEEEILASGPKTIKSSYYDITITKPRPPVLGWCQALARRGLCALYADSLRQGLNKMTSCAEACGLRHNFTPLQEEAV